MTRYQKIAYDKGREAAMHNNEKIPPVFNDRTNRWFWLAGYSDYEIENGL